MKAFHTVRLCVVVMFLFAALNVHAFFDPSVGRWASRDPIEERGFQTTNRENRSSIAGNPYAFVLNDSIGKVDRLGLDYYIIQVEGACEVRHRIFVGDDGVGNSYQVDIMPVVNKWYQEWRRLCGKGVINYYPHTGAATNWFTGMVKLEKHVVTTPDQDKDYAAKAKSLDGRSITYCLFAQDCRSIEKCTTEGKTLGQRNADKLAEIADEAFDSLYGSTNDP